MKTSHLVLIIQCLLLSTVWAQQPPNHFVIGAWGVSPDYIEPSMVGADTIHTVWPVVGAWNDLTSPPSADSIRFLLPRQRLIQASDLGLNTVYVRFDPQHIVRSENPRGLNAVAEVCAMAEAENLDVCVDDMALGDRLFGERIILHPESGYDFYERGSYLAATDDLFDLLPLPNTASSRNLLTPLGPNAVVIEPGKGEISTPSFTRIQELSYASGSLGISGRYHISVIVKDHPDIWSDPSNDTSAVLLVSIDTKKRFSGDTTLVFRLPGSALLSKDSVIRQPS